MNKERNGWVYIMSNIENPDTYKIGKTKANPVIRANGLSRQTGTIGKWEVEWEMEVPDMTIAEQILHYKFREKHYEKEYFKISLTETKETAEKVLTDFFGIELQILKAQKIAIEVKKKLLDL